MDQLVIHYPFIEGATSNDENNAAILWSYYESKQLKDKGHVRSLQELCQNELINRNHQYRTHVWINSEVVTLRKVSLPKSQHQHRQTIIPQILEDEVNEDINDLHFVCGQRIDNHYVYVAIIQKQIIEKVLADFKQYQLDIHSLLPDNLSLHFQDDQCTLYVDSQVTQCRVEPQLAYHFDTSNVDYFIQRLIPDKNTIINLFVNQQDKDITLNWDDSKIKIHSRENNSTSLPEEKLQSINLLQGQFATRSNFSKYWPQTKLIIILLLASTIIHLLSTYLDTQDLRHQSTQYKEKSYQLFREKFPNEKRIINLKAQVQQQLSQLQENQQHESFFNLLSIVSPIIVKSSAVNLTQLNFDQNTQQLHLYLNSTQFEKLEQFNNRINSENINSKPGVITWQKGKYSSKLTISPK